MNDDWPCLYSTKLAQRLGNKPEDALLFVTLSFLFATELSRSFLCLLLYLLCCLYT